MDLYLPEKLREELKKPFGKLYPDALSAKKELTGKYLIAVGDKVAEALLSEKIVPDICIYDGRTQRKEISVPKEIKEYAVDEIIVKNPAAQITQEAVDAIKKAASGNKKTKIFVVGEEDLLALPAITSAPTDAYVIYGQPNEGLVIVKTDSKTKEKAKKIMDEMKR